MPYRILLVEDDTTLRETVAYNLQRRGDEVITAGNRDGRRWKTRGLPSRLPDPPGEEGEAAARQDRSTRRR